MVMGRLFARGIGPRFSGLRAYSVCDTIPLYSLLDYPPYSFGSRVRGRPRVLSLGGGLSYICLPPTSTLTASTCTIAVSKTLLISGLISPA